MESKKYFLAKGIWYQRESVGDIGPQPVAERDVPIAIRVDARFAEDEKNRKRNAEGKVWGPHGWQ